MTDWMQRLAMTVLGRHITQRDVRGIPVTVENTRPDIDTAQVLARLDASLALIEQHLPYYLRRMRRDFDRLVVRRYPCRGAYIPATRTCIVELTFTVNPGHTEAEIAATILHEAMHARLDRAGVRHDAASAARHERFCRRAEVELGAVVPGGARVLERARAALELEDAEVAPQIDWELARQRTEAVDRAARRPPNAGT